MKFSIMLESIIVFLFFLLILIPIYSWIVLIEAISLLTEAVPQYFFWLLPSEEFNNFSVSLWDIFGDYNINYLDKILYIFYIHSESHNCLLYRIVTVFIYSLWFILLIILVSINNWP